MLLTLLCLCWSGFEKRSCALKLCCACVAGSSNEAVLCLPCLVHSPAAQQLHGKRHRTDPSRFTHACVSEKGGRSYQEDAWTVCPDLLGEVGAGEHSQELFLASVFDGHGGATVAQHVAATLPGLLREALLRQQAAGPPANNHHSLTHVMPADSATHATKPGTAPHGQASDQATGSASLHQQQQPPASHAQAISSVRSLAAFRTESSLAENVAVHAALLHSFEACDQQVPAAAAAEGGTTAVCALVGRDRIYVANTGKCCGAG
ncbi:hypothetical protein QJQ45_004140 [Haematococcus lacustris]|nr:hypothetical protein QJQ45_004140 [Haematococcus lacustris]